MDACSALALPCRPLPVPCVQALTLSDRLERTVHVFDMLRATRFVQLQKQQQKRRRIVVASIQVSSHTLLAAALAASPAGGSVLCRKHCPACCIHAQVLLPVLMKHSMLLIKSCHCTSRQQPAHMLTRQNKTSPGPSPHAASACTGVEPSANGWQDQQPRRQCLQLHPCHLAVS